MPERYLNTSSLETRCSVTGKQGKPRPRRPTGEPLGSQRAGCAGGVVGIRTDGALSSTSWSALLGALETFGKVNEA